jgi:hypothetical protein
MNNWPGVIAPVLADGRAASEIVMTVPLTVDAAELMPLS